MQFIFGGLGVSLGGFIHKAEEPGSLGWWGGKLGLWDWRNRLGTQGGTHLTLDKRLHIFCLIIGTPLQLGAGPLLWQSGKLARIHIETCTIQTNSSAQSQTCSCRQRT